MALDFFEASESVRNLFELASSVTKTDVYSMIAESDGESLKRTDRAQISVTLANLAAASFFSENGLLPCAVAGHSLGEYAALAVSGVISYEDCFFLVKERGLAMHNNAPKDGSGMAAVMGLSPENIEKLLSEWQEQGLKGIYAANFNSPRQTVVSGTESALAEAGERFKTAGARRFIRLPVAGAFHSPLMSLAAAGFSPALEKVNFCDPKLPVFSNVTGARISSGAEAKSLALRQITSPVRWTAEEEALSALVFDAVIEVGPGTVLAGLWRDFSSTGLPPAFAGGTLAAAEEVLRREQ